MWKQKFLFIQILTFLFSANLYSQTKIRGQVFDKATLNTIPFSLIQLSDVKTNNVTNEEGVFNFNISKEDISDTLFIKCLGYTTYKIAVKEILKDSTQKFYLLSGAINLSEVTVKPINIEEILNNSARISSAYFNGPVRLKGYYRELVKRDSFISKYADGSVDFYLQPNKKNSADISIKINQSRVKELKLEDDDKYDGFDNKISMALLAEYIQPSIASVLDSNNFKYYKYNLKEVSGADNIYIISFIPKLANNQPLYEGTIIIDKETNLIMSLDYKFSPTQNFEVIKKISMLGISLIFANTRTIVKFKLESGKYYPVYIYKNGGWNIQSKKVNQTNEFRSEFITSDYNDGIIIKPNELFKKKYLYQNGNHYENNFWESLKISPNTMQETEFLKQ